MRRLVAFTGAGISSESGLRTFRDTNGLWEEYRVEEVATPEAWNANPKLVLEFYNKRRKQINEAEPNQGHKALVELEQEFETIVVTQNIDNLHERAGSSNVLHLHGEINKSRSSINESLTYNIEGDELKWGEKCALGSQLRPDVVWFGEAVPNMELAAQIVHQADVLVIVGTSLNVQPAAGLVHIAPVSCEKYLVDPGEFALDAIPNLTILQEKASTGVPRLAKKLLSSKNVID